MPAIWTFPASCSMVQSASSPLPWLDLSPDWPRLRATLQAGRLGRWCCWREDGRRRRPSAGPVLRV